MTLQVTHKEMDRTLESFLFCVGYLRGRKGVFFTLGGI